MPFKYLASGASAAFLVIGSGVSAQTVEINGQNVVVDQLTPPGGRCVPTYFNTVSYGPGDVRSDGTTNLGTITETASNCVTSLPPTDILDGEFTIAFSGGDTITGTFDGRVDGTATPGTFASTRNYTISGGTGRFTGATGTITQEGLLSVAMGLGNYAGTLTGAITTTATVEAGNFATAYGDGSAALKDYATAYGGLSIANGVRATAIGAQAEATGASATAVGDRSMASGLNSLAAGTSSSASGTAAIALGGTNPVSGRSTSAAGNVSIAIGPGAQTTAAGLAATAIGPNATASGIGAVALGGRTQAAADRTIAIGGEAVPPGATALRSVSATSAGSIAIGAGSVASGSASATTPGSAVALGQLAEATNSRTAAVGERAAASGENSLALGAETVASGLSSSAVGYQAAATGVAGTALGHNTRATALAATAVGVSAQASQTGATAVGRLANAAFAGSTAIGANATTTAANQVALGGAGSAVRIGDIAASTAAQSGTLGVATVDANGVVGRNTTVLSDIAALQTTSTGFQGSLSALGGQVNTLFDLRELDRSDFKKGVAAAVAMGNAAFPSAPGKTSYVLNGSVFRGEAAVGGSLMHRFDSDTPIALGVGFSFAGKKNNAARVGVAGEF